MMGKKRIVYSLQYSVEKRHVLENFACDIAAVLLSLKFVEYAWLLHGNQKIATRTEVILIG